MSVFLLFQMTGGIVLTPCDSVISQTGDLDGDSTVSQVGDLGGDEEISQ